MTSSTLARPRLSPRVRTVCRTRVRGIPPRYESSVAVSHSFEQRDLRFVRAAFEFYVRPLRSAVIFDHRLTRSRLHSFRRSVREREIERERVRERERLERDVLRSGNSGLCSDADSRGWTAIWSWMSPTYSTIAPACPATAGPRRAPASAMIFYPASRIRLCCRIT